MQKINHFTEIEKLIYDNPISRELRFINISSHDKSSIFYYDCLLPEVVLLDRIKVLKWKEGHLQLSDFPFSTFDNINIQLQPPFHKYSWTEAVKNAKELIKCLDRMLLERHLNQLIYQDIQTCIDNIRAFFNSDLKLNSQNNLQIRNSNILDTDIDLSYNFKSPKLFQEYSFHDKHKDEVYLLLEKIFNNFNLFSKYQITETHIQAKKIDEYLYNHMKNIYLSNDFPMIDLEEETLSILNKINAHLVIEIDKYLEKCIENQMSIIESIHHKFLKQSH